jgi:hypothetical protein
MALSRRLLRAAEARKGWAPDQFGIWKVEPGWALAEVDRGV